jgi:hypothetical protein
MATEPLSAATQQDKTPDTDPLYSHASEVSALRRSLARLESELDRTNDPAAIARLAGAIARTSNSIVRALAAHHKLAALAEKSKLAGEWEALETAREQQERDDERRRQEHARSFRSTQDYWLRRVAEAAHDAAAGDAAAARDVASGLDAYIETGKFTQAPDRYLLARLRNEAASAAFYASAGNDTPSPSNLSERDPVVQLT